MSPTVPAVRGDDAVVLELHLVLANLRVERAEIRPRARLELVLRLVEFVLADRARVEQRLQPLDLPPSSTSRPLRAPARRLGTSHRRGLLAPDRSAPAARPARTWSPDLTKILVTCPSTCG